MATNTVMEALQTAGTTLQVSTDGTTFQEVPYVSAVDVSGGERNVVQVNSFKANTTVAGNQSLPNMSITLAAFVEVPIMKTLIAYQASGDPLTFRVLSAPEVARKAALTNRLVAIATTGVATFSGSADDIDYSADFAIGTFMEHAPAGTSTTLECVALNDATDTSTWYDVTTDAAPTTALTAMMYRLYRPQYRSQFLGSVLGVSWTAPEESVYSGTLTITPSVIPQLKPVIT